MSVRSLTILAFLVMTLSSSMGGHACGEDSHKTNQTAQHMDGHDTAMDKSGCDCVDMSAFTDCDGCAVTCLPSLYLATLPIEAINQPAQSLLYLALSPQVSGPHNFRFLRPPIA